LKTLKSLIAIRIMDSIGVVSKEMRDVRNPTYLNEYDNHNVYSGRVNYTESEFLIFLYVDVEDSKYMTIHLEDSDGNVGKFILCVVCDDLETEDSDLNKLIVGTKNNKFREASFLESSKILNTFEAIRDHMPNWDPNEATTVQLRFLFEFISSIKIE